MLLQDPFIRKSLKEEAVNMAEFILDITHLPDELIDEKLETMVLAV